MNNTTYIHMCFNTSLFVDIHSIKWKFQNTFKAVIILVELLVQTTIGIILMYNQPIVGFYYPEKNFRVKHADVLDFAERTIKH